MLDDAVEHAGLFDPVGHLLATHAPDQDGRTVAVSNSVFLEEVVKQ